MKTLFLGFIQPSEFKSGIGFAQKIHVLKITNLMCLFVRNCSCWPSSLLACCSIFVRLRVSGTLSWRCPDPGPCHRSLRSVTHSRLSIQPVAALLLTWSLSPLSTTARSSASAQRHTSSPTSSLSPDPVKSLSLIRAPSTTTFHIHTGPISPSLPRNEEMPTQLVVQMLSRTEIK